MADVARGHGGDCGGGPPGGGGNWQPPSDCQTSGGSRKGREKSRNLALKKNSSQPEPIDFEKTGCSTYVAVGKTGTLFRSLLGNVVSRIPYHFPAWAKVPQEYTAAIIPEMESYFDLRPHLEGPDGQNILNEIMASCAKFYRDRKNKFKKTWWDNRGGQDYADELLNMPPPNMDMDDWQKYVGLVTSENFLSRSNANKTCRSNQIITTHQGRKSFAQFRFENRDAVTLEPPSAIEMYRRHHSRNGQFTHQEASDYYEQMLLLKAQQLGVPNSMTDEQIVESVLGSRRGWQRGIGQKLPQSCMGASSSSQSSQGMCTREEVEHMISQMRDSIMADMWSHKRRHSDDEESADEGEEDDRNDTLD